MKLHPYQRRTTLAIWASFRRGNRRVLFTLPTGTGKTVVLAHMIRQWTAKGLRVLFLAHTKEIIDQTVETLEAYGLDPATISVIMRKHAREAASAPLQVASLRTICRRSHVPACDVVIIDEAHHAVSPTYRRLVALFPDALVLGATATPFRFNGVGLDADFDELVIGAKPSELVPEFMSKARIWSVSETDLANLKKKLKKIRTVAGDYSRVALDRAMNKPKLVGDIVQHCRRIGLGHPTVVYAAGVPHAKRILEALRANGFAAEIVHAKTLTADRASMLGRLASGETHVIVNCLVLVEGWNCPVVKRIVLARPTRSLSLYLQILGRGLRPGDDCIVLDHTGTVFRFGFPHTDRGMTLVGVEKAEAAGAESVKLCPRCSWVSAGGAKACENPACDHVFGIRRELQWTDGSLSELVPEQLDAVAKSEAARLHKVILADRSLRGAAKKVFRARFGASLPMMVGR